MHTYNDLYQTCDEVLTAFVNQSPRLRNIDVYKHVKGKTSAKIDAALYELIEKKCIIKENRLEQPAFNLIGHGQYVYDMGGFKEYLKELNRKEELKNLLDDYSLKTSQSVIDTNSLVGQNVKTQELLTKYALTIAFFAALFPAITLVKDILRPQQLIDKDTQQIMKKQQESIQHLQQSLDTLNLSIKNLKTVSYKIDTTKK
jgi:hypothetical protein